MSKVAGVPMDYPTIYPDLNEYLVKYSIDHPQYEKFYKDNGDWDELLELLVGAYEAGISHENGFWLSHGHNT